MSWHSPGDPPAVAPSPPVDPALARLADPVRLSALRDSGLLHGAANPVLDGVARVVAFALDVPMAFVALVDDRRQHLPGITGASAWAGEGRGTPLSLAYAQQVVTRNAPVVLDDVAADVLAAGHPALNAIGAQAFLGVPLRLRTGEVLGALCAAHTLPVRWRTEQLAVLEDLAATAVAEVERLLTAQALAQAETRWEEQAERDRLTGLLNRRGFAEHVRHHLALSQRTAAPLSIAVIDIEQLRHINEVFGHEMGDRALVELAEVLLGVCRETDLVARLEGGTFAVLLCNTNREETDRFDRRLAEALLAANATPGRSYQLRACLGAASWTLETPHTLATLLRVAEETLHIEKGHRAGTQGAGL